MDSRTRYCLMTMDFICKPWPCTFTFIIYLIIYIFYICIFICCYFILYLCFDLYSIYTVALIVLIYIPAILNKKKYTLDIWSLKKTLNIKLKVFERFILRKIYSFCIDTYTKEWWKQHKNELDGLFQWSDIANEF